MHPDYTPDIRLALDVLLNADEADDPERLVAAMLQTVGVHTVSFEYVVQDRRNGRTTRHRFAGDPLYRQIQGELPAAMTRAGDGLKSVAMRSAGVKVVKRRMREGASPGEIVLGPAVLFG